MREKKKKKGKKHSNSNLIELEHLKNSKLFRFETFEHSKLFRIQSCFYLIRIFLISFSILNYDSYYLCTNLFVENDFLVMVFYFALFPNTSQIISFCFQQFQLKIHRFLHSTESLRQWHHNSICRHDHNRAVRADPTIMAILEKKS